MINGLYILTYIQYINFHFLFFDFINKIIYIKDIRYYISLDRHKIVNENKGNRMKGLDRYRYMSNLK